MGILKNKKTQQTNQTNQTQTMEKQTKQQKSSDWPCIGIDLGTTFSCCSVMKNGQVQIIENQMGNRTTPSYVAFTKKGRKIGDAAKNQAARNPKNTIFDAKRLIGRKTSDMSVQKDMKLWPFEV